MSQEPRSRVARSQPTHCAWQGGHPERDQTKAHRLRFARRGPRPEATRGPLADRVRLAGRKLFLVGAAGVPSKTHRTHIVPKLPELLFGLTRSVPGRAESSSRSDKTKASTADCSVDRSLRRARKSSWSCKTSLGLSGGVFRKAEISSRRVWTWSIEAVPTPGLSADCSLRKVRKPS